MRIFFFNFNFYVIRKPILFLKIHSNFSFRVCFIYILASWSWWSAETLIQVLKKYWHIVVSEAEELKVNHFSQSLQSGNFGANVIDVVMGGG